MASQAKEVLHAEHLDVEADRGYFNSPEILACEQADISVTLPKPMTSVAKSDGRFGKQDFRYVAAEDVYICPAGERLAYHYTNEENGLVLRRYWTNACRGCAIKYSCTTGKQRRITRWEHEHVLEAVQQRLDENPQAMRQRRETAEHPFARYSSVLSSFTGQVAFQHRLAYHNFFRLIDEVSVPMKRQLGANHIAISTMERLTKAAR
jgi:hypothetical protein